MLRSHRSVSMPGRNAIVVLCENNGPDGQLLYCNNDNHFTVIVLFTCRVSILVLCYTSRTAKDF